MLFASQDRLLIVGDRVIGRGCVCLGPRTSVFGQRQGHLTFLDLQHDPNPTPVTIKGLALSDKTVDIYS